MGCTKINNVWIFCTTRNTSLQRYLLRRQERITYEVVVGEKSLTISLHKHTELTYTYINTHKHSLSSGIELMLFGLPPH